LKLLANVGLVGLPNAGKSTLLSHLTKARPKVADYPFTTLEPFLGVLNYPDGRSLVMADIPGLIEGASEGKGLGFDFLRHLVNCKTLVYVLSLKSEQISDKSLTNQQKVELLKAQLTVLERELREYNERLASKKQLVVINKTDLYSPELQEAILQGWGGEPPVMISAATGVGLAQLRQQMWRALTD